MKECSEFTPWIVKLLEADGAIVIPMVAGVIRARGKIVSNQSGWPDRLVFHRLWHGFLEIKVDANQLSGRQKFNIRELCRRRPGSARVVRGFSDGSPAQVETHEGVVLGTFSTAQGIMDILTKEVT